MQNNNVGHIQEDEIDLRELFKIIWDKRIFIVVFTFLVTIISGIYIFSKTPIYEAKALIELGSYKLNNNNSSNNNIVVDNVNNLSKKLNFLFIEMKKNEKSKGSRIIRISTPKNQMGFLEITSHGINNELAILKIQEIITYITKEHKTILNDVKQRRELKI